jgi:Phosphotransferase system IIB components
MEFEYVLIGLGIIVAFILLYFGYTHLIKNKNLTNEQLSAIDINVLIKALGGKENIVQTKSTASKLTVSLLNHENIDMEKIKALGASGIVEGKENLTMIFGKQSQLIEEDLKHIL